MGSAKTPEKQREYYLAWKAKKPESYALSVQLNYEKKTNWTHICSVFRHILIADCNFEPRPRGKRIKVV
jgi:hypothetical protein